MPFRLVIPEPIYAAMVAQALVEQPNECVGLLAGVVEKRSDKTTATVKIGRVIERYPLVNEAHSPKEFFNLGKDLFEASRDMRNRRLDTLAVYHSHPSAPPQPSKKDIARNYQGPNVISLIISLLTTPPTVRAWWLRKGGFREAECEVR